jgi:hypothetical protein
MTAIPALERIARSDHGVADGCVGSVAHAAVESIAGILHRTVHELLVRDGEAES